MDGDNRRGCSPTKWKQLSLGLLRQGSYRYSDIYSAIYIAIYSDFSTFTKIDIFDQN